MTLPVYSDILFIKYLDELIELHCLNENSAFSYGAAILKMYCYCVVRQLACNILSIVYSQELSN